MKDSWRRNLYAIWIATFASLVGGQLAMPFMPLFINRDLGVSDPGTAAIWAGIATAGSGIVQAIMSPIWGVLADRHGRKPMLVRAQFAIGASNVLSAFAMTPLQISGIRMVQGGFSGVVGASRALVASSVPRDRVAYSMGLIQSAIYLGQTIGPAIGGVIGSVLGFRMAFFATGIINAGAGAIAVLFIKEFHQPAASSAHGGGTRVSFRALATSRALATLCLIFYLGAASSAAIRPILSLLMAEIDPTGDVAVTSGAGFALLGIAGAVTSIGADRLGRSIGIKGMLVLSGLLGAVAYVLVGMAGTSATALASLLMVGLGQGAFWASSAALVSLHAPASRQGTAFGVLTSAQALANGSGPLVSSFVAARVDFHAPFFVIAGAVLIASLLGWTLPDAPAVSAEGAAA